MVRRLSRIVCYTAFCCCFGASAVAQDGARPIRLRARTFVPAANVVAGVRAREAPGVLSTQGRRHVLIQFSRAIDATVLAEVRRAGATPLRYVPDDTISAAAGSDFDPAAIAGARWVGALEPADRISPETAADLAKPFPYHPLTFVEFHPDVEPERIALALADVGTLAIAIRNLPRYAAVIPTDRLAIERLASRDEVAWIYPVSSGIDAAPVAICDGVVRPEGIVANYAAMGDGWDGPGRGSARLGYVLSTPSADLDRGRQLRELTRAMDEWSRYVLVHWHPGRTSVDAASVNVLWGPTDHGDGFPFEPAVLAHAFYPAPPVPEPIAGDVHFNDTLDWGTNNPQRWDVFSVALHEIGHSLGLMHSGDPDSVMYPLYRGIVSGLTRTDIDTVREIYASTVPETLPAGWVTAAIGGNTSGSATEEQGLFTVVAGGRDIWSSADEFRFVSRMLSGDGDIVARVDTLAGTHRWSKAGVMIRASEAPGAPHAFALVSQGRGLAFQRRRAANGLTTHTSGGADVAPSWLWLSRRGNRVEAYAAPDGGEWQLIGFDSIALGPDVLAGLAVTNHDTSGEATAVFSRVSVTTVPKARWTSRDIGDVGRPGSWSMIGSQFRVRAAGQDIWGAEDAFHFVWQTIDGDTDIVARLASLTGTRSWTKAGVMIRAGLEPGAAHAFMLGSVGKGFAFQRRPVANGLSVHTAAGAGTAPAWLKLSRRGDLITAYRSTDGKEWTEVGSEIIPMARLAFVGLAVSSHTSTTTCQAVFEFVRVATPNPESLPE